MKGPASYLRIGGRSKELASLAPLALLIITVTGVIYWRHEDFAYFTWHFRVEYLLLSAAMFTIALLLVVWLWARLMEALGQRLPYIVHLRYFGLANIAKRLPGTIWYIAGRAYLYRQRGVSPSIITVASGLEIITLTLASALVAIAFAGPQLIAYINSDFRTVPMITALLIISLVLVHPSLIKFIIKRVNGQEPEHLPSYGFLLIQVLLSAGVWIAGGIMFYSICASITSLDWIYLPYVIGVWALSSLLSSFMFFLPTNLGVKEVSSGLLLAAIMPWPIAVLSTIISRLVVTAYETLWAIAGVWLGRRGKPRSITTEQTNGTTSTSQ